MGFQLVIAEGKESGREFVFDQSSVVIGRTAECDVILYEAGVSRKHARIFIEGEEFVVEDLGSSNGTKVNTNLVQRQPLKSGDSISLGPVVFTFSTVEVDPSTDSVEVGAEGEENHTRVVSLSEMQKSRNKAVAMLPKDAGREELKAMGRASTKMVPAVKGPRMSRPGMPRPRPSNPSAERGEAGESALARGAEQALGDSAESDTNVKRVPARRPPPEPAPRLSAAERARMRRQEGNLAGFKIWWSDASKKTRTAVLSVSGILSLVLIGAFVWVMVPEDAAKRRKKEPAVLTADPIVESFGVGESVTFTRVDQKVFEFDVKTPVQALAIVHFQSSDISAEEVAMTVNGVQVGWLPPDTMLSAEQAHEILVPASLVNRVETNTVTFDNVKNPPDEDPWKFWNVWVEIAVLPERGEDGLKADAIKKLRRGEEMWEQRDIGASNRWESYKAFREAWLTLEALPEGNRPPTHLLARDRMGEVRKELDLMCNKLLLDARSLYSQKQYEQARFALDHVNDFFPSKAHPCQYRAEVERYEFGI